MRHISSLLQGLARSLSVGKERKAGDDDATAVLRASGAVWGEGSETLAAVCSRRGEKGINQDCSIVCEGDLLVVANVGDSRAVLGTAADDDDAASGAVAAVQLTVDFKPNLPQERERIMECNGRVQCLADEPGVHRVWRPDREGPGLAMSRAFGDYCVKDCGVISAPEVTQRRITGRDQFVILATDGVWDVVSNEEAVQIVATAPEREKAAKRLVEFAVRAWRRKRRGIAVDDCSAICLFFHSPPS
uniref:protein-serine/threonine phosphatase n=1 Tax=Oryza brachyantha TaxID=4533 RepID=J3M6A1_ORYBR